MPGNSWSAAGAKTCWPRKTRKGSPAVRHKAGPNPDCPAVFLADALHASEQPGQDADAGQGAPGERIAQFDAFRQQRRQTNAERRRDDEAEERIACATILRARGEASCFVLFSSAGSAVSLGIVFALWSILRISQGIKWRIGHHERIALTADTSLRDRRPGQSNNGCADGSRPFLRYRGTYGYYSPHAAHGQTHLAPCPLQARARHK